MKRRPVLLVAAHVASWGRALLMAKLAEARLRRNQATAVLISKNALPTVAELDLEVEVLPSVGGLADRCVFADAIRRLDPSAIVHFDLQSSARVFLANGEGIQELRLREFPTATLDVWDSAECGFVQDLINGHQQQIYNGPMGAQLAAEHMLMPRLVPVPFANISGTSDRFHSFIDVDGATPPPRGASEPATVLFASGAWQLEWLNHGKSQSKTSDIAKLASNVIGSFLSLFESLNGKARLVHVGPAPIADNSDFYIWHMQVSRSKMRSLIANSDLVLSTNLSSTLITDAIALHRPVCLMISTGGALPPYWVWPLGFYRFLNPVANKNPLLGAISIIDLGNCPDLQERIEQALFDTTHREAILHRQQSYYERVARLPTIDEALDKTLCAGIATCVQ